MRNPLDPFSRVLDERSHWDPEWYSWLQEISDTTRRLEADVATLQADVAAIIGATPPAPAGTVFISSQTITSPVATIVFTGLTTAYDTYIFEGANLRGSIDGGIGMQMSPDNGATWYQTTQYYYDVLYGYAAAASGTAFQSYGSGVGWIYCGHGQTYTSSPVYTSNFTVTARGMSVGSVWSNYTIASGHYHGVNAMMNWFGTAMCVAGGVNAARFFNFGGGNLTSGSITLYGVRKT